MRSSRSERRISAPATWVLRRDPQPPIPGSYRTATGRPPLSPTFSCPTNRSILRMRPDCGPASLRVLAYQTFATYRRGITARRSASIPSPSHRVLGPLLVDHRAEQFQIDQPGVAERAHLDTIRSRGCSPPRNPAVRHRRRVDVAIADLHDPNGVQVSPMGCIKPRSCQAEHRSTMSPTSNRRPAQRCPRHCG